MIVLKEPMYDLNNAFERLHEEVCRRMLTNDLSTLSIEERRYCIAAFIELGALELREAVNKIAAVVGVSRVTVYNYVNGKNVIDLSTKEGKEPE
jgi:predicted transcriptional regulator YheO